MTRLAPPISTRAHLAALTFVLALSNHLPLSAHDMWIEPTTFAPSLGRVLGLKLRVGDDFRGEPIPRADTLIERFVVADGNGQREVVGQEGADPAGLARVTATGPMVIGYQSQPHAVTLTADKFASYLKEQSLDHISALQAKRARPMAEVRELFVRCAKSLVSTPGATRADATAPADRQLGLALEIVAEVDARSIASGRELPFRLTYRGQALAATRVIAVNQRNPWDRVTATTDANGRVRLTLPAPGVWMVKAVHMVEAPAGVPADWMSYWASVTFDVSGSGS